MNAGETTSEVGEAAEEEAAAAEESSWEVDPTALSAAGG